MKKMMKRLKVAGIAAGASVIWGMSPSVVAACDSCWGASVDTPTTQGITMAMLALIGMTSLVWGGIGAFFLNARRRTQMLEPGDFMVTENGEIQSKENRGSIEE